MNKETLLLSAKKLVQPGEKAAREYSDKVEILITSMNTTMLDRDDIKEMVGESNIQMMKDNHANHARFMESVFNAYVPEVLVDTVLWVFRAYRSRNFSSTYWSAQLNTWLEIYKLHLTDKTYAEVLPFYKWMQVNIPIFNSLAESDIDAPLSSH